MDEVEITDERRTHARGAPTTATSPTSTSGPRRLIGTLDALGVADDTVVVLLADHGDMLGERGLWYKMNFFEGSARIPLIVHAPQRFAPERVADPVSLVDVLPTLIELAGAVACRRASTRWPGARCSTCARGPSGADRRSARWSASTWARARSRRS